MLKMCRYSSLFITAMVIYYFTPTAGVVEGVPLRFGTTEERQLTADQQPYLQPFNAADAQANGAAASAAETMAMEQLQIAIAIQMAKNAELIQMEMNGQLPLSQLHPPPYALALPVPQSQPLPTHIFAATEMIINGCASVRCVELELSHLYPNQNIPLKVYHRAMEKFILFGDCYGKTAAGRIMEMLSKMELFKIRPTRRTYHILFRAFATSQRPDFYACFFVPVTLRQMIVVNRVIPDEQTVRIVMSIFKRCDSSDVTLEKATDALRQLTDGGAPITKVAGDAMVTRIGNRNALETLGLTQTKGLTQTLHWCQSAACVVETLRRWHSHARIQDLTRPFNRFICSELQRIYDSALLRCVRFEAETEAQEVLQMMAEEGIARTVTSYNHLLLALSVRKELAAEQWRYFEQMTGEERIQPNEETLVAMVAMWRENDAFVTENAMRISDALRSKWVNVTLSVQRQFMKNVMLAHVQSVNASNASPEVSDSEEEIVCRNANLR